MADLIQLSVAVPSIVEVMKHYNRIRVYRSVTTQTGEYVEITTLDTRPVLESGKSVYDFTDTAGSNSYWYRTAYYNQDSGLESTPSVPQQGELSTALQLLTVEELKDLYLFGVDMTKDDGTPFPETLFQHYIRAAVAWLESHLGIPLAPHRYVDEPYDFVREDYRNWVWFSLNHYPLISVEKVDMYLPGGQLVRTFDSAWFQYHAESGQLQLTPPAESVGVLLLGASGVWPPYMLSYARSLPNAFRITYTAGFAPGTFPENLKAMIAMKAALGPLNIAGELIIGAGIASTSQSLDGVSQSISSTASAENTGYGARIKEYERHIKDDLPQLKRYYRGIRMVAV